MPNAPKTRFYGIILTTTALLLTACDSRPAASSPVGRNHAPETLQMGQAIYTRHCARCHGDQGQGAASWRQKDAAGFWPPPPLNGSGHAWHHPWSALMNKIRHGARPGEGKMPAFGQRLSDAEISNVIFWLQSKWPEAAYQNWAKRQQNSP